MHRRQFIRQIAGLIGVAVGAAAPGRLRAQGGAKRWQVRRVQRGDESALVALMRSCVADESSFHGRCAALEWTSGWAQDAIGARPRSLVVTRDDQVVAYLDLPQKKPRNPSAEVERNQQAFWCGAGGVRADLLSRKETVRVFHHLLYRTFTEARGMGFDYVRCAAPWDKHPSLPTAFTDYPGLTMSSFTNDQGEARYLIEWRLEDAIAALAAEGAGSDLG